MSDQLIIEADLSGEVLTTYQRRALLGTGGFAHCYEVVDTLTRQKFAAKIVPKKDLADRKTKAKLLLEIKIHRTLKHRNIVGFQKVFEDKQNVYIIMQLCQNQTLKQFQRRRCRLTEFQVRCYTLQLLSGVQYLHQNNIIHRDLKLGNVFINSRMQLKIGDFGLSTKLKTSKDKRYTTCGTPNYIAPEILAETGHSFEVDLWAMGVMIFTLLVGKPAFECESVEDTYERIKMVEFQFPEVVPLSEEVKDLIGGLLRKNPQQRLSLEQMRKHPFLSKEVHKIPDLLPSYTISIPPEGSYLRQFGEEKFAKVTVLPRRISRRMEADKENRNGHLWNSNEKSQKENKMMFLSSGNLRRGQDMDKAAVVVKQGTQGRPSTKQQLTSQNPNLPASPTLPRSPSNHPKSYQTDTNQITQFIDMISKYGIGYMLASGSIGVVFNDSTSLTRISQTTLLYYQKSQHKYNGSLPQKLKKKSQILKLTQAKFKSSEPSTVQLKFPSSVHAKKYIKYQETLVVKLSNGVMQFFWKDGGLSLRGYKWVNFKIQEVTGEGAIFGAYPEVVEEKMAKVREFLRVVSERQLTARKG